MPQPTRPPGALNPPGRRDKAVAAIIARWRALTAPAASRGGRGRGAGGRTLIACSGGADSSALALALAAGGQRDALVLAHIVHDLRPARQALKDRDAARTLARALGLEFVEARVRVRAAARRRGQTTNLEAAARAERYTALARLAAKTGCAFIATAHHADDQLETILMRLMRGAGPRGLRGIAADRPAPAARTGSTPPIRIIRPLLGPAPIRRADLERLCREAGWAWREDATNADTRLLRSAVRARLAPVIEELSPGAAARIAASAELFDGAWRLIHRRARRLAATGVLRPDGSIAFTRAALKRQEPVVLGEWARTLIGRSIDHRALQPVITAIADASTDPRTFSLRGQQLEVRASTVVLHALAASSKRPSRARASSRPPRARR